MKRRDLAVTVAILGKFDVESTEEEILLQKETFGD